MSHHPGPGPAIELCRPLGNTLQLVARRLDALLFEEKSADVRAELQRVRALTAEALHTLHDVSDAIDELGVSTADLQRFLCRIATSLAEATGAQVEVQIRGHVERIPTSVADIVGRVVRESLFLLQGEEGATSLSVCVGLHEGRLALDIRGDGGAERRARDDAAAPAAGLVDMSALLAASGGRLLVQVGQPRGVCLQAVMPLGRSSMAMRTPDQSVSTR